MQEEGQQSAGGRCRVASFLPQGSVITLLFCVEPCGQMHLVGHRHQDLISLVSVVLMLLSVTMAQMKGSVAQSYLETDKYAEGIHYSHHLQ